MIDFDDLPPSWNVRRFDDVLAIRKGNLDPALTPDEEFELFSIPAFDESGQPEKKRGKEIGSSKVVIRPGDCLFSKLNPRIPRTWVVPAANGRRQIASTEFWPLHSRFKPSEDGYLSPELLQWLFRCAEFLDEFRGEVSGGVQSRQRLQQDAIRDVQIPVPPLAQQRRLVARIEALTSRLEQARQARRAALAEADSSSRSIIAAAFAALDDAPTKKLGDIAGIIGGAGFPEDGPRPESENERVGLLKVSDMNAEGNGTLLQRCRLETTLAHARKLRLRVVPCGAVVFPKRGGAIATNKKRTLAIPAALDPNMMGVFPLEGSGLTSEFLRWWFESIDLTELQEDGGIPQVNKKHLAPLEIPVPSPAEQRRIVSRLDALAAKQTELRRLQTETEAALAAFTPALLAKAFRGEL